MRTDVDSAGHSGHGLVHGPSYRSRTHPPASRTEEEGRTGVMGRHSRASLPQPRPERTLRRQAERHHSLFPPLSQDADDPTFEVDVIDV